MNMYWNMIYLERPPYVTWSIKSLSAKKAGINIDQYNFVLDTAINDLGSMDILHGEAAALSRLIYRMKNKFRNDKGLKSMVALNKALINYYNMSLLKEYKKLRSVIEMEGGICILPSKQMLEYVLVRTQGFAKLMTKVESTAKYAAHFLKARINLGHAWSTALIALATVSRIWFCSRHILRKSCDWYDQLYICSKNFEYVGVPWIPKNQSLPCNLKLWLSLDWLNIDISMHDTPEQKISGQFAKISDSTNEKSFNIVDKFKIDFPKLSQENALSHNASGDESDNNDIGEVVARKTFEGNLPKVPSNIEIPSLKRKHVYADSKEKTMKKQKIKKDSSDKNSIGAVRECLFAIVKVFINLTHQFNRGSFSSKSAHKLMFELQFLLSCMLESLPEEKRFDMMMLVLVLLINLVKQCDNKRLLIESTAPSLSQYF